MPEELYSENESLDRIYRLLKGEATSEAPNTLVPPLHSTNESLSRIAELLAGTLEGEQGVTPVGMESRAYGQIFTSIISEAGSTLTSGTWVAVPLAGNALSRGTTPDHVNDRIAVTEGGTYLIGYKVDFAGTKDAEYEFALYLGPTVSNYAYSHITLLASGSYASVGAISLETLTDSELVQAIVRSSKHGANFSVKSGQLWVKSV